MASNRVRKKGLICFHGSGSKGSIFQVQMARLYTQLRDTFEFIFLDGPQECEPGPGVLPIFSGQEPYYSWLKGHDVSMDDNLRGINEAVRRGLDAWSKSNPDADVDIVGGLGFSEGGLALTLMLWLQQEQQEEPQELPVLVSALPRLQFAAISCCFFPREVSLWMDAGAQADGKTGAFIDVPTLHIHGNRDFCLGRARQLVRKHYRPEWTTVIKVDTSHHMPTQKDDVTEVAKQIRRLAGIAAPDPLSTTSMPAWDSREPA